MVLEQVEELLKDRQDEEALTLLQAIEPQPVEDPRFEMLYGVALSQTGKIEAGLDRLRRATLLDPTSARAAYNLAVVLFDDAQFEEASTHAEVALKLDPSMTEAITLRDKCRDEIGTVPLVVGNEEIAAEPEGVVEAKPAHVLGLGESWTKAGQALLVLAAIMTLFLIFRSPLDQFQGNTVPLKRDGVSVLEIFLYVTVGLASCVWMLVDIIDRKRPFVWLLPIWVCSLAALPGVPLAFYIFVGRKVV